MMIAALLALAAGAVAGLFLAIRHFRRKRLPAVVALLHGIGGATGFTLVLLTVVREPDFRPIRDSLYLLIATVAFGVVNLLFHVRRVRHRTSLILLHALCAVSGVGLLIRAIVVHEPVETASAAVATPAAAPRAAETAPPLPSAIEPVGAAPSAGESTATPPSGSAPSAPAAPEGSAPKVPEGFSVDPAVRQALDQEIRFESKSATIESSSMTAVADMARALNAHPEVTLVEVQGHADERGDDVQNIVLTRARAHSVVTALTANGVSPARLHEAGYGARCPADSECRTPSAPPSCHATDQWQKDRRVTFVVLQVGKFPFRGEVVCAAGAALIPPADKRFNVYGK
jgi:outer membrane protein OmpA-like peptidoglycan-associated protein